MSHPYYCTEHGSLYTKIFLEHSQNLSAGILSEINEISIVICSQITWYRSHCIVFVNIQLFTFKFTIHGFHHLLCKKI